ncbi:hypothetical protein Tco_1449192 [Tanacetum coccineum]
MESNGNKSRSQDDSSRSGNDTDDDDADIRPIYDEEPMAEVGLTNEARKKRQERDRNSKTSMMPSIRFQSTADDSKPKPRSNNQTSRSLPVSKSSCVTITAVPKADHSNSSSSFSDSKTFVCSTCHTWKPTGRIFKSVGLRWIPTGKLFDSCTSKVDSEPPHGSNVDIPNIYECKQTLDVVQGCNKKSMHYLLEILPEHPRDIKYYSEDGKSCLSQIKQALGRRLTALSWKPCQGDSLNLPDHMFRRTGVAALFQRSRIHKPHAHTHAFKSIIQRQDS